MKRPKISIIGAGNVGATVAHLLALKELGDIVLVDIGEDLPKGKSLDLSQAGAIENFKVDIKGTNRYEDIKGSDIVVITAGMTRKSGMSRDDLIETNTKIVKDVSQKIAKHAPKSILIVVTNPLDVMTFVASKASKFSKHKVIGMAGVLDTARFKSFISKELRVQIKDIDTMVIGSHGDLMVPLLSHSYVKKIPLTKLMSKEKINVLVEKTKKGGAEIVHLLKTGSAFYAPASSVAEMVESILKNKKKVLPCCAYCDSEYGVKGYFVGVPVELGKNGVEKVVELKLNEEERKNFNISLKYTKKLVKTVEKFL